MFNVPITEFPSGPNALQIEYKIILYRQTDKTDTIQWKRKDINDNKIIYTRYWAPLVELKICRMTIDSKSILAKFVSPALLFVSLQC